MADTMKFGPEWLRALSDGGVGGTPAPVVAPRSGVKIADYRYGREEMLALFQTPYHPPEHLREFPHIFVEETQKPIVMLPLSEDEQRIMSQGVNSTVVLRTGRGGGPPLRGGRGGSVDRGRGRGRGRGEVFTPRGIVENGDIGGGGFGRPRGPNKDGWEEVGRKMDRSYSRPYDEAGSGGHPRYIRSMSDNWRDKAAGDEEDDGDWRKAGRDRWSTRTNWRDPGRGGLDPERRNGAFSRGRGFEPGERGRRGGEPCESEDVPEWAEDGADDVGTFDSSGAFVSYKVPGRGFYGDEAAGEDQSSEENDTAPTLEQQCRRSKREEMENGAQSKLPNELQEKLSNGTAGPPPGSREAAVMPTGPETSASSPPVSVVSVAPSQPSHSTLLSDPPSSNTTIQQAELTAQTLAAQAVSEAQKPNEKAQEAEDENALKWFYTDPQGEVQGPFTAEEMAQWFSAGYFTMNLLIKRGCDQQFQPLGDLIKRWGHVPFLPGSAPPPMLVTVSTAVEMPPISTPPVVSLQQAIPTSVPVPLSVPPFPPVPVSGVTDPILMQQQLLLQQQILQQQLVIRQLQMQTLAQLQEKESFKEMDPLQQQRVGMEMMQANPLLLQQMQALQHLQQMQQHTQQQASQGQTPPPPAAVPQSLAQSQAQQHGADLGLPASSPTFHRSLSQPQPMPSTDGQGDILSIWGSIPTSGSWAQPTGIWDLESGSAQLPPAMKSELEKLRQEKEAELARLAEEERKRQEEIIQQQEELHRQQEALHREREQMQREKEELERQRQLQRLEEARRQQEEEQKRREEEEAERRRLMEEEAERKRRAEEQRRKEEERERQEEERRRQKEQRRQEQLKQEAEEERRQQEELRRKRELEEQAMLELQCQEQIRQQQEVERQRQQQEAERRQQELEAQRKMEFQRQQQEALQRLQRQQQLASMQLPSTANWARQQHQQGTVGGPSRSLAEIQQEEERKMEQQMELQRQRMLQAQAEQTAQQQPQQQKSWASNFVAQQPGRPKTLAEIQEEEERQLRQEKQKRQQHQQHQAKTMSLSTAAVWGSGSGPGSALSGGSAAWGGGSVWGSENSVSLWGSGGITQPSAGAANSSKGKKAVKESSAPSSEFPALKTVKMPNKTQQAASKAAPASKPKKEEEAVQRLFQQQPQQKDEFTMWCEAFLEGMDVTIDIETFVSFLQAVDSPYEVHDYVRNYLGEGKDAREFAKQFMEKRSHYKNKARTEKRMEEESIWRPAPALNPREMRGVSQQANADHSHGHGDGGRSKGGKKKKKMQKLDGSALLGFTVEKDPNRKNAGEIESFP